MWSIAGGVADVKGVFVVEAEAATHFMHDISKANAAEAGLHLLTAVLSQHNASRDAVAATEAHALQVDFPHSCSHTNLSSCRARLGSGG